MGKQLKKVSPDLLVTSYITVMELRKNIKLLRNRMLLSQTEVAQLIGVTRQTIEAYESGTEDPDDKRIEKMLVLFKVTEDELFNGIEDRIAKRPVYTRKN